MDETALQRALRDAPTEAPVPLPRPEREYFLFVSGGRSMAVASELVREVARLGALTPLPRVPPFVLGVVGHRGEVFPLVDLQRFLGQGHGHPSPRARLFITAVGGSTVGFLVDEVEGLRRIADGDRLPPPRGQGLEHVTGVLQVKGRDPVTLLDLAGIVEVAHQRLVSR